MATLPFPDQSSELSFPLNKEVVLFDRIPPFWAGALTGVFGGGAFVAIADALMSRHDPSRAFLSLLSHPFERVLPEPSALVAGVATFVVAAALISGTMAVVTRRLKKLVPLAFWSMLFFGSVWILGDAFLVAKMPWLAAKLPFFPILAGVEAFAFLASLELPIRIKRGLVEVEPRRDSLV
ncbi:MAG TPA: hypothetical protein VF407_16005 [Polyangiaceae bacterium]